MERRNFLAAGIGAGILAVADLGRADDKAAKAVLGPVPAGLLQALETCAAKAQACAAHCQVELANGDTAFAHCSAAVNDVLAVTWAAHSLISRRSPNAKKIADTCAATCKECSAACNEHRAHWAHNMHLECKECMDACDACAKACLAFIAS